MSWNECKATSFREIRIDILEKYRLLDVHLFWIQYIELLRISMLQHRKVTCVWQEHGLGQERQAFLLRNIKIRHWKRYAFSNLSFNPKKIRSTIEGSLNTYKGFHLCPMRDKVCLLGPPS